MTLDEMIAWLSEESARALTDANLFAEDVDDEWVGPGCYTERAATLLTIANALRAVRDGVAA